MNGYHKNPRIQTEQDQECLRKNLIELGDISGVVHDLNSNEIPCGNFRSKIVEINACEVEIIHRFEKPDAQGTAAWGYIIWEGQRLSYRQVRWTAEQCEKACITANSLGGDWDYNSLLSEGWNQALLGEWGVDIPEEFLMPENITRVTKDKPATMKLTFADAGQLEQAKGDIGTLLKEKYPGAFLSVSCGEM